MQQSKVLQQVCRRWLSVLRSPQTCWYLYPLSHWESHLHGNITRRRKKIFTKIWVTWCFTHNEFGHTMQYTVKHRLDLKWWDSWSHPLGCLPKADKMAADQKISPMSAGMNSRPPILFPYSCWKGSSMVTYPRDRMGLAKKSPPEWCQMLR